MAIAISLLASLITFAFAGVVLRQYSRRRRLYRLVWALALIAYGVATTAQFVAEIGGWGTAEFRIWYLSGGLITAAFLGQGTAFLLLPRRISGTLCVLLVLASVAGAARIATVSLDATAILPLPHRFTPRATSLPTDLRLLAVLLNIYGTLLLVGGAVWSALDFADHVLDRRRRSGHRFLSNILIAAGAMVVAGAGSLEALGREEFLYVGEIVGISVIFAGFLRSQERIAVPFQRYFQRTPEAADPAHRTAAGEGATQHSSETRAPSGTPPAVSPRRLKRISDRTTSPHR